MMHERVNRYSELILYFLTVLNHPSVEFFLSLYLLQNFPSPFLQFHDHFSFCPSWNFHMELHNSCRKSSFPSSSTFDWQHTVHVLEGLCVVLGGCLYISWHQQGLLSEMKHLALCLLWLRQTCRHNSCVYVCVWGNRARRSSPKVAEELSHWFIGECRHTHIIERERERDSEPVCWLKS